MRHPWKFHVTHQDQTKTLCQKEIDPPGIGPVDIRIHCECGHTHNLIGSQTGLNSMSGSGHGSVVPPNDPGSEPPPREDEEPSWNGSPGSPDPDEKTSY